MVAISPSGGRRDLHVDGAAPYQRTVRVAHQAHKFYADLVRTYRGSGGGVTLARAPGQITVRQVYEAVEGPVLLCRCRQRVEPCGGDQCDTHDFWEGVESLLNRELDTTTFAALARRTRSGATGTAAGTAGRR